MNRLTKEQKATLRHPWYHWSEVSGHELAVASLNGLVSRFCFHDVHGRYIPGRMNMLAHWRHFFWKNLQAQLSELPGLKYYGYCPPPIPTDERLRQSRPCQHRYVCPWCHARMVNRKAYRAFSEYLKTKPTGLLIVTRKQRTTALDDQPWTYMSAMLDEVTASAGSFSKAWVAAGVARRELSGDWVIEVGVVALAESRMKGWRSRGRLSQKMLARACGSFCKFPIYNLFSSHMAGIPELWNPSMRLRAFRVGGYCSPINLTKIRSPDDRQ